MSISSLPIELLDDVTVFVDPKDYASLALVNPSFYHVVQRHLYRHVYVDKAKVSCIEVLGLKPEVAGLVRTFVLKLNRISRMKLPKSWYQLLHNALSHMSELTSLEIIIDQSNTWVMNTPDHATYSKLRRFVSSCHLDQNIAHFLNKADALLDVTVDSSNTSRPVAPLPPTALPLLQSFTGSAIAAQVVVPGRPVAHIAFHFGDLTQAVANSLAKSTVPILTLTAATSPESLSSIGTLTKCMEHIVHLRIVTHYHYNSVAPDWMYFSNVAIADTLTSLPDLQTCEIWGIHWISKNNFHDKKKTWELPTFAYSSNSYSDMVYPY